MSEYEELRYKLVIDKSVMDKQSNRAETLLAEFDRAFARISALHDNLKTIKSLSDLPNSRGVLDLIQNDLKQLLKESEK